MHYSIRSLTLCFILLIAIPALATVSKETLQYWQDTLEFGTPTQKLEVLKLIRRQEKKEKPVMDILIRALKEATDNNVRKELVQILYEKKDPRALQPLVDTLKDTTDPQILATTLVAIGQLKDKKATIHITNYLGHDEREVVQAAVRALGTIGDGSVGSVLLSMLTNTKTDKEVVYDLVNTLGTMRHKPAFPEIRKIAINTGKPKYLRAFAITAMGLLGDTRALEDFFKLLKTEKISMLRARVIAALGEMNTPKAVKYLKMALGDGDKTIRIQAVKAAGKIGAKKLIRALMYRLKYDKEPKIMVAAAESLQKLDHKPALKVVIKKFETSRDNGILGELLKIIEEADARSAIPILRKKQTEMKHASIKDKIEALLKKWGAESKKPTASKKPAAASKAQEKDKPDKPGERVYLK